MAFFTPVISEMQYPMISYKASRNLQPLFYKAFRVHILKITHFFKKTLDKSLKICGEAD